MVGGFKGQKSNVSSLDLKHPMNDSGGELRQSHSFLKMQITAFSPRSLERARGVNKMCYVHPEWHGDVLCAFSMTWVCVMCAQHGMSTCHVPSAWPGFHNTATLQSVNTDRHHQRGLGEVQT